MHQIGDIFPLDAVREELTLRSTDELAVWLQKSQRLVKQAKNDPLVFVKYQEASNFVLNNHQRWTKNVNSFLTGADLWIISFAMTDKNKYLIVTDEKPDVNQNCKTPKIPAVAKHLGCHSVGLWTFLREVKPKFILDSASTVFDRSID